MVSPLIWRKTGGLAGGQTFLGFSFSLNADGSYGVYNDWIGRKILDDMALCPDKPWVGVQWEIMDRMDTARQIPSKGQTSSEDTCASEHKVPRRHVVSPPAFRKEDILKPASLEMLLRERETVGGWAFDILRSALAEKMAYLPALPPNATEDDHRLWLAGWLNALLDDDRCWRNVARTGLQLRDAVRLLRGTFAVIEHRVMPDPDTQIGHYQRRRVNRLMIDALGCISSHISNEFANCFKPMGYITTQDVINTLLDQAQSEGHDIRNVRIYGHPVHVERCAKQFLRTAWQRGWSIGPDDVYVVMVEPGGISHDDCWTPERADAVGGWQLDTSQEWCRSLELWLAYNAEAAVAIAEESRTNSTGGTHRRPSS